MHAAALVALEQSLPTFSPPIELLIQFTAGFFWAPYVLGIWIVNISLEFRQWVGDNIVLKVSSQLKRSVAGGRDPEIWVEFISAGILICTAFWFAVGQTLAAKEALGKVMPLPVWILWSGLAGIMQGFTASGKVWRARALADALAALYWGITSFLLFIEWGYTALHPSGLVMAGACGLVVMRYFHRSERNGSTP